MSLRSPKAHGHVTRAILWKFTGKMPDTLSGEHVFNGNLQEKTHMDMSQEPFCVKIQRKKAGPTRCHLDQTPGLLL